MKRAMVLLFFLAVLVALPLAHADTLISFESELFFVGFSKDANFWLNCTTGNRTALVTFNNPTATLPVYSISPQPFYGWQAVYLFNALFASEKACLDGYFLSTASDTIVGTFYYRFCTGLRITSEASLAGLFGVPVLPPSTFPITWLLWVLGFCCLVFSPCYVINEWKKGEYRDPLLLGISIFTLGIGLFFGGLYHG
jgi:hypothetical protein